MSKPITVNIKAALDETLPFDYILVTVKKRGAQVYEVLKQKGDTVFLARYTGKRFPLWRTKKSFLVVTVSQINSIVSID